MRSRIATWCRARWWTLPRLDPGDAAAFRRAPIGRKDFGRGTPAERWSRIGEASAIRGRLLGGGNGVLATVAKGRSGVPTLGEPDSQLRSRALRISLRKLTAIDYPTESHRAVR
jgi:hypothetical protein